MKKFVLIFLVIIQANLLGQEYFRWAADAESNAPYIFQDAKNPSILKGFEYDIANRLANRMNMKSMHVQNQWDGLIPGLSRGDYVAVINGIEVTEDRKREVLFSIPYYHTFEQLVVRTSDYKVHQMEDLNGKAVGALKNSLAERILRDFDYIKLLSYEGEVNAFEDLANGRIDAALVDYPIALYYTAIHPELKMVGEPFGEVVYAIAIHPDNPQLLERVNLALSQMIETGEMRVILEKWNLWNSVLANKWGDFSQKMYPKSEWDNFVQFNTLGVSLVERLERYISVMPLFGRATLVTLTISIISMILAIILGSFLAIMKIFGPKWISITTTGIIEVIRGTPLLIQLFIIFYALPSIGIKLSPMLAAIVGLGINYAAYEAENYRAGLVAIARGQMEAALSLGMGRRQALRFIIFPQSFKIVIPPVTNDFISLLKDSSLVSVITMVELTKVYNQVAATYFDYLGTGIIVAIIYLLIGLPFVRLAKYFEKRYGMKGLSV